MPLRNPSRRTVLVTASAAVAALAMPGGAFALTTDQARALIDKLVGEINAVIASGKSEGAMIKDFENIFSRYADVNFIALSTLGPAGRGANKAVLGDYVTAFRGYLSRKYGKRFREFIGGKIEVKTARPIKAGYEVRTTAYLSGQAPFEVVFLVSDKSGKDKFFNMFIEGVSLLQTERTEMGAMLDKRKGNIDQLIADLSKIG